jgi:drug/metabolite transporter (DMT)-like permease
MMNMTQKYTWIGLSSILIWASLVAVVKLITDDLTPISGIALIYTFSAFAILILNKFPSIRQMPKSYLYGCGALFVGYEILFLIAIAFSHSHEEVLVIAMINYLWPPITILFSIFAQQLKFHWLVIIGFVIAVVGLLLVVNPKIFEFARFSTIIMQNPKAYAFAFIGALLWPSYSVLTKKYAQGFNAVPLFFLVTAFTLWGLHFYLGESFILPSLPMWLLIIMTGSLIGIAYSNWNQSIQFGNIQLLILATYFMPILSSLMSMMILNVYPSISFWMGSLLVSIGALICWKSTSEV